MAPVGGISLVALIALAATAQPSEPIPVRVAFDAPTGCSSAEAFYGALAGRSSRIRRAADGEEGVRLVVTVTRAQGRVHGELQMIGGPGGADARDTRKIEGATCDEVVEVLSLTAALSLVPSPPPRATPSPPRPSPSPSSSSSSSSSPSSSPSSSSASPPPPPPPAAPPPEPTPPPPPPLVEPDTGPPPSEPRAFALEIGAGAVAGTVLSPTASLGGAVTARVAGPPHGALRPSLGLAFVYLPNDFLLAAGDVVTKLTAGSLTACPAFGLGNAWLRVQPCAQAMGGWLTADERMITNPRSAARTWWSAGALLRAGAALGGGFSLELEAGLNVLLARRRFTIDTPERTVAETGWMSALVGIGVVREL